MAVPASAILDVQADEAAAKAPRGWHAIGVCQVRLACGLVMFSYIFSHFFNHALGNLSYSTMEAWLRFHVWWWRIPVVNFTLYAAAVTHLSLGLWALSLRFKVPHASVCGGKGRCSTCRIRVVSDRTALPPPSGREVFVLARVGASANPAIRLACQLRPKAGVAVIPVLPANIGADFVRNRGRIHIGEEHYVVSMFVDMRGSTKLAEARLPYDTVFLVNRFLEAASQAVIDAGGQPNQFVGDGLLALFGLHVDPATASRQAIRAAATVAANVAYMNHEFATELDQPITFGIGINGGEVIIGDIGFREHTVFTALGDAVNVAARLQDMTKTLGCSVVVSGEVFDRASIRRDRVRPGEVSIRGRDRPVRAYAIADASELTALLDDEAIEHAAIEA